MARGWESKAVEDQIQGAQLRDSGKQKARLGASELEIRRRKEVLLLSRVRVQRDLETSQNPRYRDQLNRALADIDSQLKGLENS
jgi:C4-dicarboxylate-specific signal transduction histidine kinase